MISLRHATSKNRFLIFVLSVLALSHKTLANDFDLKNALSFSGSFRSSYWSKDKTFSDKSNFLTGSLWLAVQSEEVEGYKFYSEAYVQGENFARNNYSSGELREFYVKKSFAHMDIKIGRQINIWGRADKINPTGNLSIKDSTRLMTEDEDQRLGLFATQVSFNFDTYNLAALWIPEWRFPKYPVKPVSGVSVSELRPVGSENQFAIKLDNSGGDIDWSLSYFDGFNKVPDLKIVSVSPVFQLGLDYGRIQTLGSDFAKSVGGFGLRGEIAYTQTQDPKGENFLQQNSNVFAVIGVDKTIIENFNLNAQFLYRSVMNYQDPKVITDSTQRSLAEQSAMISGQMYKDNYGISLRPSYKMWNETLEMEAAYITRFQSNDSLLRPKITYSYSDKIRAILGAEIYSGNSDTLFGQLKDTSSTFMEIRYLY